MPTRIGRGCVGLDPSEGTASQDRIPSWHDCLLVALGSTRVRVLQDECRIIVIGGAIIVALGSTRVRVLQDQFHMQRYITRHCCVGLDPSEGTARVVSLFYQPCYLGCVGLDPSEGTARYNQFALISSEYQVALGSTRVRVLQVIDVLHKFLDEYGVALGSTRVRVLQDSSANTPF